jgi:hypothetical protein
MKPSMKPINTFLLYYLLLALVLVSACKSKKKAVDITRTNTEVTLAAVEEKKATTIEDIVKTDVVETTIRTTENEVIEITGPVEIGADGSITVTDPTTKIIRTKQQDTAKDIKENTINEQSRSIETHDTKSNDSTYTQSSKERSSTIEKKPDFFAGLGISMLFICIIWAAWRFIIKPRFFL